MSYHAFKLWLVMKTVDMMMSQHQITWDEIYEGVDMLKYFRAFNPLASIPQPDFNPKDIKGHTPT